MKHGCFCYFSVLDVRQSVIVCESLWVRVCVWVCVKLCSYANVCKWECIIVLISIHVWLFVYKCLSVCEIVCLFKYLKQRYILIIYWKYIFDNFKSLLVCFNTFGVRHPIFVLDSENQPGSGKIRIRIWGLGLTGDAWHQKYENKKGAFEIIENIHFKDFL